MNRSTPNISIRLIGLKPYSIAGLMGLFLPVFIVANAAAEITPNDVLGFVQPRRTYGGHYLTLPEMLKTHIFDISSSGSQIGKTMIRSTAFPYPLTGEYWTQYGSYSIKLVDEGTETLTMYDLPAKYFIYDVELEFTFTRTTQSGVKTTKHVIFDGQIKVDWHFASLSHIENYVGYEMYYSVYSDFVVRESTQCDEAPWYPSGENCFWWVYWSPATNLCQLKDGRVMFYVSPVIEKGIYSSLGANFYFPVDSNIIARPKGIIQGQLRNAEPVDEADDISEAVVELYRQDSYIRPKSLNETLAEYNEYIKTVGSVFVDRKTVSPHDDGQFTFTDIPVFGEGGANNTQRPMDYTIKVTAAKAIELDINHDPVDPAFTVTTLFANKNVYNVRPFPADFFDSGKIVDIALTPADIIAAKQQLIDHLSLVSPGNYLPIENGTLQPWLNTMTLTPEHIEAVKRGRWSELIIRDGTLYADRALDLMLSGLGTLMADIFDELTDFTRSDIRARKAEVKKIEENKNASNAFFGNDKYPFDSERYIKNLNLDSVIGQGDAAGRFTTIFKYVKTLVITAAIEKGVPEDDAKALGDIVQQSLNALAGAIQSRTAKGTAKSALKYIVEKSVGLAKPYVYDDASLPSYTTQIKPFLQTSVDNLMNWNQVDEVLYENHRGKVIATINELGLEATSTINNATTLQAAAGALDVFEGIVGLAAESGDKRLKLLELLTKMTKYALNSWSIIDPYLFVFDTNKKLVKKGVYEAYGLTAPQLNTKSRPITSDATKGASTDNRIYEMIPPAADNLKASINAIVSALNADDIESAMIATSDDTVGNYFDYLNIWNQSVSLYLLQVSSFDSSGASGTEGMKPVSNLLLDEFSLKMKHFSLVQALRELYVKVLTNEYSGVQDPLYILKRDSILYDLDDVMRKMNFFLAKLESVNSSISNLNLLPVISGKFSALSSDLTGKGVITESPETFVVAVELNNISSIALDNVSAKLSVDSPYDSVDVISAPQVAIGSMAAYDGADGGPDYALLEWTITYTGDFAPEGIIINVRILEDGDDPVAFVADSPQKTLYIDPDLLDNDLDLMPDDWEVANGLDKSKNDSLDDKDGDGLSNIDEFYRGTDPDNPDSDEDGLSDGVELNGSNNLYITDPLVADSDNDGVRDGDDQQPLDGSTDQPGATPSEATVAVDQNSITLTPENDMIIINVSNSGTGTLSWTALPDNPTAINVSPHWPEIRNGDGKLLITLPRSYNSETQPSIDTTIRVVDVAGAIHDSQTINIHVGAKENTIYDLNGDGKFDFGDLLVLSSHWLSQSCSEIDWCQGSDINKDTSVDFSDFATFCQVWASPR